MKILIQMGDSYPDESPCAKRMRCFYDTFTADGHEVKVLAPRADKTVYYTGEEIKEGAAGAVYCPTVKLKKKTVLYRLLNSVVFGFTSFLRSLTLGHVDVVISTCPPPLINIFGWMIAKVKRAKLVYDVRDIWPDVAWEMGSFSEKSIYSRGFAWVRDFMLEHADFIIAVSPGKVQKIREYNPRGRVYEITNGLDEEFLENKTDEAVVEQYGLDQTFTVCYIGNLGLAQGLRQLLEVAYNAQKKRLNVQFLLFGSGADEEHLRCIANKNNLENVQFCGRIPNKQIYTILKHSKVSFVPLVNEKLRDSVPTKIYEALGVGCPVLLSACGDSAEIIRKTGFGEAVRPNDKEALWNAFKTMYENIESYTDKAEEAQIYTVEHYSRQRAAKELERILAC